MTNMTQSMESIMDVKHKRLMYSSYIKLFPLKKEIGKWTTKFTTHLNLSREKSQMTICSEKYKWQ